MLSHVDKNNRPNMVDISDKAITKRTAVASACVKLPEVVRNEFANGATHVNGIEGFWGFFKIRLSRFRGMIESTFYLHLKECEFRFHYRDQDTNRWRGYRKTLL